MIGIDAVEMRSSSNVLLRQQITELGFGATTFPLVWVMRRSEQCLDL